MTTATDGSEEAELRRHILDTARHLLVQEGYKALSMRTIADAIGYSATSIYLHFDGKDALLHALIHEGMMALRDRLRDAAAQHPDVPGSASPRPLRMLRRVWARKPGVLRDYVPAAAGADGTLSARKVPSGP